MLLYKEKEEIKTMYYQGQVFYIYFWRESASLFNFQTNLDK
jgi:hypothetical protein